MVQVRNGARMQRARDHFGRWMRRFWVIVPMDILSDASVAVLARSLLEMEAAVEMGIEGKV